jgi:hypothetical protein
MIYFIVLFIFIIGCLVYGGRTNPKDGLVFYIVECIILILLASFRSDTMGGDALLYADSFRNLPTLNEIKLEELPLGSRFQPLWLIFNALIKTIYDNFLFYKIIHALIVNISIFAFAYKFPKYKFYFVLLFLISKFWYFEFEIQREVLAICAFLISFEYLKNKQYLKYFAIALVAFLFHVSALFLFCIPILLPITQYLSQKSSITFILIISILLFVTSHNIIFGINNIVGNYIEGIYLQGQAYFDKEKNINGLIKSTIDSLFILLLIGIRKNEKKEYDFLDNFLIIMLFISILGISIEGIYRLKNYLYLFYLLAIIDISKVKLKFVRSKVGLFLIYLYFMIDLIYYYSTPALFLGPNKKLISAFYPYISIF